jgi:Cell Wall Hydrolase
MDAIPITAELLDDLVFLAKTLYGEARNQNDATKVGVAWTLVNRARRRTWYGKTVRECALKPHQYTCWSAGDPNRAKLLIPLEREAWLACLRAAYAVLVEGVEHTWPEPPGSSSVLVH